MPSPLWPNKQFRDKNVFMLLRVIVLQLYFGVINSCSAHRPPATFHFKPFEMMDTSLQSLNLYKWIPWESDAYIHLDYAVLLHSKFQWTVAWTNMFDSAEREGYVYVYGYCRLCPKRPKQLWMNVWCNRYAHTNTHALHAMNHYDQLWSLNARRSNVVMVAQCEFTNLPWMRFNWFPATTWYCPAYQICSILVPSKLK